MIIGRNLMVQLGLTVNFKLQVLQWYGATVHMNYPSNFLGQSDLTKGDMRELVMQSEEPVSTREATERMVKVLDITYVKEEIKQVAENATQLNTEERNLLLSLLKDFKDYFYGTLGEWSTKSIDLELKPYSEPFNSRYYTVPKINKKTFRKEIKRLLEIRMIIPLHNSQYYTPVFNIPNK